MGSPWARGQPGSLWVAERLLHNIVGSFATVHARQCCTWDTSSRSAGSRGTVIMAGTGRAAAAYRIDLAGSNREACGTHHTPSLDHQLIQELPKLSLQGRTSNNGALHNLERTCCGGPKIHSLVGSQISVALGMHASSGIVQAYRGVSVKAAQVCSKPSGHGSVSFTTQQGQQDLMQHLGNLLLPV